MRNRLIGLILTVVAVLAVPTVFAQNSASAESAVPGGLRGAIAETGGGKVVAPASASPSDLSGVWMWAKGKGEGGKTRFSMKEPPLQPGAMEKYLANRKGIRNPDSPGLAKLDPSTYCFPSGVPRDMLGSQYPFEIVQKPSQNSNRVLILDETNNAVRQIWMDGREHPVGWPFGWMGHSIGKWEGDTLVVDTVGRNDRTWLDVAGTPHSDALHIVERMRRINHETLEIDFLFEDSKAFTKTWGAKRLYQLRPDLQIAERIACEEHLKLGN